MSAAAFPIVPFEVAVSDASGGNRKVQKGDYLPAGSYPVVDQGQTLIGGYSDDHNDLVAGHGPWIVFGDHTRSVKFMDRQFCMGADGVKVLVPKDSARLDAKYLYWFLIANEVPSAGYSRHYKFLKRLHVPLPPLDEQRRIAAILDKADALRQKRKRAIALLDSLTQSIFVEMFGGDSAGCAQLRDVARIASGSTPPRSDSENFGGTVAWVKTTEVKGGTILATEEKVSDRGVIAARLKTFVPGTILMAMYGQGTTRGNVALLGIPATINQACAAIMPAEHFLSEFLFVQLSMKYEEIRSMGRGGNQPNLNLELVGKIEVLVPPIADQRHFISRLTAVNKQRSSQISQGSMLEESFASLQHSAFSGQL